MCIVAIAWRLYDDMPLMVLSNRDEFLNRPTQVAHVWQDKPIWAGRDLKQGGTWLGVHSQNTDNPRWGVVLNFQEGVQTLPDQRSRGALVCDYIQSDLSPKAFAKQIALDQYAGFNLIIGDKAQAVIVNNRGQAPMALHTGLHVVSNADPQTNCFKAERLRRRMAQELLPLIQTQEQWLPTAWQLLSDTTPAPLKQVAKHPVLDAKSMQALSAICVDSPALPGYGTRTQSILTLQDHNGAYKADLKTQSYPPKIKW